MGKIMKKKSHILVTKTLMNEIPGKYQPLLTLGSILPDLLFHTYITGHTWDSSYDKVSRWIYRLEKYGRNNFCFYLMLGYTLHYIEDFFTFAHNSSFDGGLCSHVEYEQKLSEYLTKEGIISSSKEELMPLSLTMEYLKKCHADYLKYSLEHIKSAEADMMYKNDLKYMCRAVNAVGNCLLNAIWINSMQLGHSGSISLLRRRKMFGA